MKTKEEFSDLASSFLVAADALAEARTEAEVVKKRCNAALADIIAVRQILTDCVSRTCPSRLFRTASGRTMMIARRGDRENSVEVKIFNPDGTQEIHEGIV